MNIGIDIDDTISNSFESVFMESQRYDIEELNNSGDLNKYGKIDNHYYIETLYPHWNEEQINTFWNRYFINMLTIATPKPYVAETIKKLREEGNKIFLITSRYNSIENSDAIEIYTKKWLEKNKIEYDELIMNAQNKLEKAQKAQIDLFIDDSAKHCRDVKSGGIKALLFNSICNQGLETPDLERVYSWLHVYKKYKNM